MLFNSIEFFLFFAFVCTQYFNAHKLLRWPIALVGIAWPVVQIGHHPTQIIASLYILASVAACGYLRRRGDELIARKVLLTAASLLFYAAWRWPFTALLLLSTVLNHICARSIGAAGRPRDRRFWLTMSVVGNLGVLAFFKYTSFLLENLNVIFASAGWDLQIGPYRDSIILPLGISFYTFQTMSYVIDVYRGQLKPRASILDVALYVSFFPQLVAGPIVRGADFVPQLDTLHRFDVKRAKAGLLLMIWGLLKKLVVADALAGIVDQVYDNPGAYSGAAALIATYCFAFQIYCDFSGYSDVAIGAAKVLGYHIPINFSRPYFASNLTTFWRRWHISLSTWLRDYLYIPLGGSRLGRPRTLVNLMATMVLGGLWHGASWNFVIWGAIHGGVLAIHKLWLWYRNDRKPSDTTNMLLRPMLCFVNFQLVCLTWVFFRAQVPRELRHNPDNTMTDFDVATTVLERIFSWAPGPQGQPLIWLMPTMLISALLVCDLIQSRRPVADTLVRFPRLSRFVIYFGILFLLALISRETPQDFIYFVF